MSTLYHYPNELILIRKKIVTMKLRTILSIITNPMLMLILILVSYEYKAATYHSGPFYPGKSVTNRLIFP